MREFDFTTMPIVDIVNEIIIDSVAKNASDIHFDPFENYLRIRIRVDGDLRDYSIIPNKYKRNLITRVKLLSGMNITESRLPQDGAIKSTIRGKDLDLRVSALPTSFGEKVVVRILDYTMSLKGIESLGFTEQNYDLIVKMLQNPNGIILITGATGSGKSTTVYSMLQKLNKEETNIITVEDPVEMNIEGINQIQINPEIGLDFANVLRSILRQDPNIILIGEIRDSETAKIAIRASITGHLVLSTLHTNNSLTTIERLLDMDVERYLLSASLKGIISQNLAKRLCKNCAKKRPTTDMEKRIFEKALHTTVDEIYEPVGCPHCNKGYKGRIALQEVLLINDEIRNAINENLRRKDLKRLIYKKGLKTLLQDGLIKVIEGITTIDEVLRLVDVDDDTDEIYSNDNNEIELATASHTTILTQDTQEETNNKTNAKTTNINKTIIKPKAINNDNESKKEEKIKSKEENNYDLFASILNSNNFSKRKESKPVEQPRPQMQSQPVQQPRPQMQPQPVQPPRPQMQSQPVQPPRTQMQPQPVQQPRPQMQPQPAQPPRPQMQPQPAQPAQPPRPQMQPQPVQQPRPQMQPQPVQQPRPQMQFSKPDINPLNRITTPQPTNMNNQNNQRVEIPTFNNVNPNQTIEVPAPPTPKRYIDSDEEVFFNDVPNSAATQFNANVGPQKAKMDPNDRISNYTDNLINLINKDLF